MLTTRRNRKSKEGRDFCFYQGGDGGGGRGCLGPWHVEGRFPDRKERMSVEATAYSLI